MSASIRRGQAGDGERLARLNGIVHELHVAQRPDYFKLTEFADLTSWFEARLADPNARVWFAEVEGRPAGYALALFQAREASPFASARRWCEVDQIAVDQSLRGHGIARALVRAVAREAAASGIEELKANTWGFNEGARRAFEQLGFEVESVRLRRQCAPIEPGQAPLRTDSDAEDVANVP